MMCLGNILCKPTMVEHTTILRIRDQGSGLWSVTDHTERSWDSQFPSLHHIFLSVKWVVVFNDL